MNSILHLIPMPHIPPERIPPEMLEKMACSKKAKAGKVESITKEACLQEHECFADENWNILLSHAPILRILKMCGLITGTFIHPKWRRLHVTYSFVLLVLAWLDGIRYIFLFNFERGHEHFNTTILLRVVACAYQIIGAIMRTAFFYITVTPKLKIVYKHMTELREVVPNLCFVMKTYRQTALATIICSCLVLFGAFLWIYEEFFGLGLIFHTTPLQHLLEPDMSDPRYMTITILSIPGMLAQFTAWHLSCAFFIGLAVSLRGCFDGTHEAMRAELVGRHDNTNLSESVAKWRLIHQTIRRSTQELDSSMMFIVAPNICFCTAGMCILLYSVLQGTATSSLSIAIQTITWQVICAIYIVLFTIVSAKLNESAHNHLHILHEIHVSGDGFSEKLAFQLNMFISQLAHDDIGVSVFTLFILKRETILVIFGTIVTYFVLLLDFGADETQNFTCNCSVAEL